MLYLLKSKVNGKYFALNEGKTGIETVSTIRSAMFFPEDFCKKMVENFDDISRIVYGTSQAVDNIFNGKYAPYSYVKKAEKQLFDVTGMVS